VRFALAELRRTTCAGLAALLAISGLDRKADLAAEDLAFTLAPCLNAAGRLDDARLAVELLTTGDPEQSRRCAEKLWQLNLDRRQIEKKALESAAQEAERLVAQANCPAVVVAGDWHPGVIGIVAGRLARRYARPVVVISWQTSDTGIGSARSVPGVDVHSALKHCRPLLISCGGHQAAAGLKINRCNLERFRDGFADAVRNAGENRVENELVIDVEVPLSMLTPRAIQHLDRLAPFGHGNPRPLFSTSAVALAGPASFLGNDGRHRSAMIRQHGVTVRALIFERDGMADQLPSPGIPIDVAFYPVTNRFGRQSQIEAHLVDWKNTSPATLCR